MNTLHWWALFRGNDFPRTRAEVSRSPFQRGHPATPRCRRQPAIFQRFAARALLRCSVALPRHQVAAKRRRLGSRALRRLGRNIARGPATFRPDRALRKLRDATPAARACAFLADSVSPLPDCRAGSTSNLRAARFAHIRLTILPRASPECVFVSLTRRAAFGRSLSLRRLRPSAVSRAAPCGLPSF